jgi:protein required for attachment to host cells
LTHIKLVRGTGDYRESNEFIGARAPSKADTMMKPDWILIANATRARLLQQQQGEPMVVLESVVHPEGRMKISDLADDRVGHEAVDHSYGGASFEPRTDAKRKEHERFARELAQHLEHQALQGHFHSITVFASNPFLGEIKAQLGDATKRLMSGAHDLDLTSVGLVELERRIAHELAQ